MNEYERHFGEWTLIVERNFGELIITNEISFTEYMSKKFYWLTDHTELPQPPPKTMFKKNRKAPQPWSPPPPPKSSSPTQPSSPPPPPKSSSPTQPSSPPPPPKSSSPTQQPLPVRSRRSTERSPRHEDDEKASVLDRAPARQRGDPVRLIPVPGLSFEMETVCVIVFF